MNIPVLGLVENMSSFVCGSCGSTTHIFGKQGLKDLADKTGTCIIGVLVEVFVSDMQLFC